MVVELSANDILNIINNNKFIGGGVYGSVYEYDDNTLLKFYHKDMMSFFRTRSLEDLNSDVAINLFVENEMRSLVPDYISKKDRLLKIINSLNSANCFLIKKVVLYNGYCIGVMLSYYKDYCSLKDGFLNLDDKRKKVIFKSIKEKLYDLMSCGIYPLDLKEENILINKDSLDVQFIDLDGDETKYDGVFRNYVNMFDTLKDEVIKGFELMEERLRTK